MPRTILKKCVVSQVYTDGPIRFNHYYLKCGICSRPQISDKLQHSLDRLGLIPNFVVVICLFEVRSIDYLSNLLTTT